ncbi:chemotaxis protein CheX [Limisalsivibrio acetivorans]|uniref:chemotaxis protein CheX n=1 Tax=Limisalsivibrio acetivorans TaxID=1304888 RepID=UPI0003B5402D|nr:chemotaxis protein CheX [Limisalsivibrio acetivorans]
MKAEHINPFIISTSEVFKTMVGVEPKKEDVYLKEENEFSYDVSGVIGLAGDATGYVIISMPEPLALQIYNGFAGEEKKSVDGDVTDAIGEILNMIAGGAKQVFSRLGVRFKISLPNVVIGKEHKIAQKKDTQSLCVKFTVEESSFVIEAALKEKG